MRHLIACAILLAACDLPSRSLPPQVVPFDVVAPQARTAVAQTFLTTTRNGEPISTTLDLVLDTSAWRLGMSLRVAPSDAGADSLRVTTDATGLARVTVTYGPRAGKAKLWLRTPEIGGEDAFVYDFPLGAVTRVFAWSSGAVYPGDTLTIAWETRDSRGYRVFGEPTVSMKDTSIAALLSDDAVLAKRTGATWARVTNGALADSSYVAVVPVGRLGALAIQQWKEFGLDGAGQTPLFGPSNAFSGPRYSPSGDTLAYTDSANIHLRTPGPVTAHLVPAALGFTFDRSPCWSADGRWVYFTGVWYAIRSSEIWRIHPDGTGAELVGPAAAAGQADDEPSISPDGTRLAFTTNRTLAGGLATVRIITVATGATIWSGPAGSAPRFSPDGTTLAFLAGGMLRLVNSDGTGLRTLTPDHVRYSGQLAWSPDSHWIAAAHVDTLGTPPYINLVDVAGNVAIRLPYTFAWTTPDWLPNPIAPVAPRRREVARQP